MTKKEKIEAIAEKGKKLNRRIAKLEDDRDSIIDAMIDKPWADMKSQKELLDQWNEEIELLQIEVQELRIQYSQLINNNNKNKSYGNKERTASASRKVLKLWQQIIALQCYKSKSSRSL